MLGAEDPDPASARSSRRVRRLPFLLLLSLSFSFLPFSLLLLCWCCVCPYCELISTKITAKWVSGPGQGVSRQRLKTLSQCGCAFWGPETISSQWRGENPEGPDEPKERQRGCVDLKFSDTVFAPIMFAVAIVVGSHSCALVGVT